MVLVASEISRGDEARSAYCWRFFANSSSRAAVALFWTRSTSDATAPAPGSAFCTSFAFAAAAAAFAATFSFAATTASFARTIFSTRARRTCPGPACAACASRLESLACADATRDEEAASAAPDPATVDRAPAL